MVFVELSDRRPDAKDLYSVRPEVLISKEGFDDGWDTGWKKSIEHKSKQGMMINLVWGDTYHANSLKGFLKEKKKHSS